MVTTKGQLLKCIKQTGENPDTIVCFWQDCEGSWKNYNRETSPPIQSGPVGALPEREFDPSYGGTEGEPCIAYSDHYIYIKVQYDGMEWFVAIPRHPQFLDGRIPWPGG